MKKRKRGRIPYHIVMAVWIADMVNSQTDGEVMNYIYRGAMRRGYNLDKVPYLGVSGNLYG